MEGKARTMKVLMFYEVAPDGLHRAQEHNACLRARLDEFQAKGVLLMAGRYGSPPIVARRAKTGER